MLEAESPFYQELFEECYLKSQTRFSKVVQEGSRELYFI